MSIEVGTPPKSTAQGLASATDSGEQMVIPSRDHVLYMEVIPMSRDNVSTVDPETERRFNQFADKWIAETGFLSDPIRKFMDRSHLKIIAMGEKVLPLILRELERKSGYWFVALDAVSPENPVQAEDQVSFDATANAWLRWGKQRGLI